MKMQTLKSALLASVLLTATSGMVSAQMMSGEADSQRHMGEARGQMDTANDVARPELPEWATHEMLQMMRMMGQGMMGGMRGGPMADYMPGRGMMDDGAMQPGMMGRGMMRSGMMGMDGISAGPMMRGPQGRMGGHGLGPDLLYGMPHAAPREMTPARVETFLSHLLERHGNPRLKIGEITEAGDSSIIAEIVTVDGALVQRLAFNRFPGLFRQID